MAVDRRVRKTQAAIKKAFIQLLEQKDLDHITISDITEAADINRGTFYLHYEDKYLLLEAMEDEYVQQLYEISRVSNVMKAAKDIEEFAKVFSEQTLKKLITHIYENMDFYRVILTLERRSKLEGKLLEIIKANMLERADNNEEIAGIPIRYFHSYVTGSMISIIKFWVQDEARVDVDTLISYIFKIVFNGPLRLIAQTNHKN